MVDRVHALDVLVLGVPRGQEQKVIAALSKNPNVEYAEPNYVGFAASVPDDPHFGPHQWSLENTGQTIGNQAGTVDADVDASAAWDRATGLTPAGPVKVAVLVFGLDQDHEDLSAKIVAQRNFTSANAEDRWGHGTHVAGIVGVTANNGVGVAGGCPGCVLMNGRVLDDDLNGAYSWYASGITWAADNGPRSYLSAGGSSPSTTLKRAVNYAWGKGPVFVAAPGVNVFSTTPNHPFKNETINGRSKNYDYGSGTSMSSPTAAGVTALVWSTPYGTSNSSVRNRLQVTADKIPGTGTYWSAGRVNAANAVAP